jgi:antitoxin YefM
MKQAMLSEDVVPIGEFKAHAASWIKKMKMTGHPLVITQNGKPAGVMISPEDYDRTLEKEKFFSSIALGLADAESGKTYTTKELENLLS